MIYGYKGAIVEYLEIRTDDVLFRGVESSLSPQDAVFNVAPEAGTGGGVTLTLSK